MLRNDLQTITNLINEVDAWKNSNLAAYPNAVLVGIQFQVNGQNIGLSWNETANDWDIATR